MPTTTQKLTNVLLTWTQTNVLNNSQTGQTNADVVIDRTISGGLNSLTSADTLTITIDRSFDGGQTWDERSSVGQTYRGGLIPFPPSKGGGNQSQEEFAVGIDGVTTFRLTTVASTPVRITATITYS
jgi:hypothetical protein